MPRDPKHPRLGRGLASLIRDSSQPDRPGHYQPAPHVPAPTDPTGAAPPAAATHQRIQLLPLDQIQANPYQPRRTSDEPALTELADSLRTHGLLQPLLVAELPATEGAARYQLIAGERRLRAAGLAGLADVPCTVRPASQQEMLELALVENLHREDLNPIERAAGYRDLIHRFGLTQEEVGRRLGQPRATVANHLRLLDLPISVQAYIAAGDLTFGHAKVLAGLSATPEVQDALGKRCVRDDLSVRQLEALVEAQRTGGGTKEGQTLESRPPYFLELERQLTQAVGTKVSIRPGRTRHSGRIVLEYYTLDDFDRIVAALGAKLES